jgi:hypothetical protein
MKLRQIMWADAPPKGDAADVPGGPEQIQELVFLAQPYIGGEQNERSEQRFERAATAGFNLMTLGALRRQPQENQEWIVAGLLVRGGTSLWGSKPKVGKTTLIRVLANAVATGGSFLGRRTTSGKVVILALEERAAKVRQHFEAMGTASEVEDRILIHAGAAPQDAVEALRAVIDQHQPSVVVVDTLGRLCRARDWNDYSEVVRLLEPITEAARQTGTHICLLHHLGKSERVDEGDSILGSTAILGGVDAAILLKKRADGSRTIRTIQRDGDDLDETLLCYDKETGIISLGAEVAEERRQAARTDVLDALGMETLTEPDIRERVGGNHTLASSALRSLVSEGLVRRDGAGKRGDPYAYRRVDAVPESSDTPASESDLTNERTDVASDDEWGEV